MYMLGFSLVGFRKEHKLLFILYNYFHRNVVNHDVLEFFLAQFLDVFQPDVDVIGLHELPVADETSEEDVILGVLRRLLVGVKSAAKTREVLGVVENRSLHKIEACCWCPAIPQIVEDIVGEIFVVDLLLESGKGFHDELIGFLFVEAERVALETHEEFGVVAEGHVVVGTLGF